MSLSNGASVTVPPGAVSQPTTITIEKTSTQPPGASSPLYNVGPAGTQFLQPVTISIPIPAGVSVASGATIYLSAGTQSGTYQALPTTVTTTASGSTATAQVGQVGSVFVGQPCAEGASCATENTCRAGAQTCVTGKPVCSETGLLAPDGTACGGGQICGFGTCIAPRASGTITASGGGTVTLPGGVVVQFPPGAIPADTNVTVQVVGGAAPPGALSPVLEFLPSMTFAQPVTVSFPVSGTPPAGTTIYWSQPGSTTAWDPHVANLSTPGVATTSVTHFSLGYVGQACTPGAACSVANVCHLGATACTSGAPVCTAPETNKPDGTSCGAGNACQGGSCVAPALVGQWTGTVPGAGFTALTIHADGTWTRAVAGGGSTSGTWAVAGNQIAFTDAACGAGVAGTYQYTAAAGALFLALVSDTCASRASLAGVTLVKTVAALCEPGLSCTPAGAADACQAYATTCNASFSVTTCAAAGARPDGTTCGTGSVCSAGACVAACVAGSACTPSGTPDPCKSYANTCDPTLTVATCSASNRTDGTTCGGSNVCTAGTCGPPPASVNLTGTWTGTTFTATGTPPGGTAGAPFTFAAARDVIQVGNAISYTTVSSVGSENHCTGTVSGTTIQASCTTTNLDRTCTASYTATGIVTPGSPSTWTGDGFSYTYGGTSCAQAGTTYQVGPGTLTFQTTPPPDVSGTFAVTIDYTRTGPSPRPPQTGTSTGTRVRTVTGDAGNFVRSILTTSGGTYYCFGPVISTTVYDACDGHGADGVTTYNGRFVGTITPGNPMTISGTGSYNIFNDPAGYTLLQATATATRTSTSCTASQSCVPQGAATACRTYATTCDVTGASTCAVAGNMATGTSCGTGSVCNAAGTCIPACVAGAGCTPAGSADPCKTYAATCDPTLTVTTCSVTGNQPDGTSCGTDLVCATGTCVTAPPADMGGTWASVSLTQTVTPPGGSTVAAPALAHSRDVTQSGSNFSYTAVNGSGLRATCAGTITGGSYVATCDAVSLDGTCTSHYTQSGRVTPGSPATMTTDSNLVLGGASCGLNGYAYHVTGTLTRQPLPVQDISGTYSTFINYTRTGPSPRPPQPGTAQGTMVHTQAGSAVSSTLTTAYVTYTCRGPVIGSSVYEACTGRPADGSILSSTSTGTVTVGSPITIASSGVETIRNDPQGYTQATWSSTQTGGALFCLAGLSCTPTATVDPCKTYVASCDVAGNLTCGVAGNQPDGTTCGTASFCSAGTCILDVADGAIGVAGGSLTTPTGVRLDVPASSLDATRNFQIARSAAAPPAGVTAYSPVYDLGPTGVIFARLPVVTFPLPAGITEAAVYWSKLNGSGFAPIRGTVDPISRTVSVRVGHLGQAFVGAATGAATRTVLGYGLTTYITPTSRANVPVDFSAAPPEILVADGAGGYRAIPAIVGTGIESGTVRFGDVPLGEYLLHWGTAYSVLSQDVLALGSPVAGKPLSQRTALTQSSVLDLTVSNMAPWQTGDWLEFVVPQVNDWDFETDIRAEPPLQPGDVAARLPIDVRFLNTAPTNYLIEGSKGDQAIIAQLSSSTSGSGLPYLSMARVGVVPSFDLPPSGITPASVSLSVLPRGTVSFDWRGSQWRGAVELDGNPAHSGTGSPSLPGGDLGVYAFPALESDGVGFISADLLWYHDAAGTDAATGAMSLAAAADALPGVWTAHAMGGYYLPVPLLLPGTTNPVTGMNDSLREWMTVDASQTRPIEPRLTAPVAPFVGPSHFFSGGENMGTTPTVSWTAPRVGAPDSYTLAIWEIYRLGSSTRRRIVARLSTPATAIGIPPGVLQETKNYAFVLSSLGSGTDHSASASVVSGIFRSSAQCVPANVACTPATTDPCRTNYMSSCDPSLTFATCSPTGFAPPLVPCGSSMVCNGGGQCVADVAVSVSPSTATVAPGQQIAFTASVNGLPSTAVTWSVLEGATGGTIVGGLYTAPSTAGTYHVVAASTIVPLRNATATVTVAVPAQPWISASPAGISPTAAAGSAVTTTVTVANGGTGTLARPTATVRYATGSYWITTGVTGTASPYTLSIRTNAYGLPPGTYSATVDVASVGAGNSPVAVPVTFVVTAPPVTVSVSPATLALGFGEQATFTAAVGASANGAVNWWVQEGGAGGIISSSGVYTAPSVAGTYHVVATSVADPSRSGSATITVAPAQPSLVPDITWLVFGGRPGTTPPPQQVIPLRNGGTGVLAQPTAIVSYRSDSGSGWLQASITGSAAPYGLQLQIVGALPATGQYLAWVDLTSAGATGSPSRIGVILYVTDTARDVTVIHRDHHVLDDGTPVVVNLTGIRAQLSIHNPEGGPAVTMPIPGVDNGDGTTTIHGVPAGRYQVAGTGAGFFEGIGDVLDLGADRGYRPGVTLAAASTPVTFVLSGLAPWASTDFFQYFSYGPYVWSTQIGRALAVGATAAPGVLVDWKTSNGGLLQATDSVWVGQLRWSTTTDLAVPATVYDFAQNVAAGSTTGTTLTSGVPASIPVALAPATAQGSIALDWKTTLFESALASLPAPGSGTHTYTLHASAAPLSPTHFGGSTLDLVELSVAGGNHDVRATFPYGAVTPPSWPLREWFRYDDIVTRSAPGATTPLQITSSAALWRAASAGTPATPLVGEVSSPQIAGIDARLPQTSIEPGPLLTWGAPAVGTATHYIVQLMELGLNGTATRQVRAVRFQTTQTQLQLPDWIFQPGMTYVVKITAAHDAAYSEAGPRATHLPVGHADFVSAGFTTRAVCMGGQICTPAAPDPCKTYGNVCDASGALTCTVFGNQPDGTICGSNLTCQAGVCASIPPAMNLGGTWHSSAPFAYTITNAAGATIGSGSFHAARDVVQNGGSISIRTSSSLGALTTCSSTLSGTFLSGTCTTETLDGTCSGTWPLSGDVSVSAGTARTWPSGGVSFLWAGPSCSLAGSTMHVDPGAFVEAGAPPVDVSGTYSFFGSFTATGPSLPPLPGSIQGTWVRTASGSTVTSTLTTASATFHCRGPVIGNTLREACYGSDSTGVLYNGGTTGTFPAQSPITISLTGSLAMRNDPAGYTLLTLQSGTATGGAAFCVSGAGCSPSSGAVACTAYAVACDVAGVATCSPAGTQPDGTSCGAGNVCSAGACVTACVPGLACTPGTPDGCHTYSTTCNAALTQTTCSPTVTLADGTICGAGGQACSAGTCVSSIVGTKATTYWTDTGNVSVPSSGGTVTALFGSLLTPAAYGTTVSSGTFAIPNAPAGSYWLRFLGAGAGATPSYVETSARVLDLGVDMLGRVDTSLRTLSTTRVNLNLSGLSAWTPGVDNLECTSSNGSSVAYLYGTNAAFDPFPAGTTSITRLRTWPSYAGLIDASKGDVATFHQLSFRSVDVGGTIYPYAVADRAYTTSTFTVTNGTTTTATVPLSPIPTTSSVTVDWRGSQWLAHLAEMSPIAANPTAIVAVEGMAREPGPGIPLLWGYGGWPDLLSLDVPASTDVNFGTLAFGNPLPAPWGMFRLVRYTAGVSVTAAGAVTPLSVNVYMESQEPLTTASSTVTPVVTPPRSILVGGAAASNGIRGVGVAPVVSWTEPSVFPVGSYYRLIISRVQADPAGATVTAAVASFTTANQSVQLPPGLLLDGEEYVLTVYSLWTPGAPFDTRPFAYSMPNASASAVTGILTTAGTRTVTGTQRTTYWADAGTVDVPGGGGTVSLKHPASGAPFTASIVSGAFSIAGIPWGPYQLSFTPAGSTVVTILDTDASVIDLGQDLLGRPDASTPTLSTPVTFTYDGLAPWTPASDNIEAISSNAGAVAYLRGAYAYNDLPVGVTTTTVIDDWLDSFASLIDPSKGDTTYFQQMSTRSVTVGGVSYPYTASDRYFFTSGFGLADGIASTFTVPFQTIPVSNSVPVDWRGSQFAAHFSSLAPSLQAPTANVAVLGIARGPGFPALYAPHGGWPDLLVLSIPSPGTDVNLGWLDYGEFLPAPWDAFVQTDYWAWPNFTAAGATAANQRLQVGFFMRDYVGSYVGPAAPTLGPVGSITVNGQPGFGTLSSVGLTPTIAWSAPTVAPGPLSYTVSVRRVYRSGSATANIPVASYQTRGTSVQIPAGVLLAGQQYIVTIAARWMPGIASESRPYRSVLPVQTTTSATSLFTP